MGKKSPLPLPPARSPGKHTVAVMAYLTFLLEQAVPPFRHLAGCRDTHSLWQEEHQTQIRVALSPHPFPFLADSLLPPDHTMPAP